MPFKPLNDGGDGFLLVGIRLKMLAGELQILRPLYELHPIDRPRRQIRLLQNAAGNEFVLQRFQRIASNGTARVDDEPCREGPAFRGGQEGINLPLGYGSVRGKKLALNGAIASVPFLRHQINADVSSVFIRPFIP